MKTMIIIIVIMSIILVLLFLLLLSYYYYYYYYYYAMLTVECTGQNITEISPRIFLTRSKKCRNV